MKNLESPARENEEEGSRNEDTAGQGKASLQELKLLLLTTGQANRLEPQTDVVISNGIKIEVSMNFILPYLQHAVSAYRTKDTKQLHAGSRCLWYWNCLLLI